MLKFTKILFVLILLTAISLPTVSLADSIIPCGQTVDGSIPNPCNFDDLVTLVNNLVDFIFKKITLPLAAIMFTYAGFKLMFSGGEVGAKKKAIDIFINVGWGLIIIAGSWVIIKTVIGILGDEIGYTWIGF